MIFSVLKSYSLLTCVGIVKCFDSAFDSVHDNPLYVTQLLCTVVKWCNMIKDRITIPMLYKDTDSINLFKFKTEFLCLGWLSAIYWRFLHVWVDSFILSQCVWETPLVQRVWVQFRTLFIMFTSQEAWLVSTVQVLNGAGVSGERIQAGCRQTGSGQRPSPKKEGKKGYQGRDEEMWSEAGGRKRNRILYDD